jgi:hypothetical protein
LKNLVLCALLILTVAFSSYSGLLSTLKANAATPISNPQQQRQQPTIPPPLRSSSLAPNTASSNTASVPVAQKTTTLTSAVDGNNSPVQNGGTTTSNSITFTFAFGGTTGVASAGTSTTRVAGFQCSLDNASPVSCTSPATIHNLSAGNHIFQIRAIDTAGNREANGASFSWIVVVGIGRSSGLQSQSSQPLTNGPATTPIPPLQQRTTTAARTSITSAIDGNNSPTQNGGTTTSNSIIFTFGFGGVATGTTTTTSGVAGFQCSLDNSPSASSCTSPATFRTLAAGNHIFQVRAIDTAGNREANGASFSWTVLALSSSSSPSAQPAGTATPVPSTASISPSTATVPSSSSGGGGTKANPSSPTINNNITSAKTTTTPLAPSTTATVHTSNGSGTNAATAPTANNNTASKATTTTPTKSSIAPKALGGWSGYAPLGGCVIGNPATGSTSDAEGHSLEQVFVVGCNHALFYKTQDNNGVWSGFTSLGSNVISNPVVGVTFNGMPAPTGIFKLVVFIVGNDNAIYYNREDTLGMWSGFIRLGGYVVGDPAVLEFGVLGNTVHTELVVVGRDHALYHNRQTNGGTWSGFSRLGGNAISNPVISENHDRRFQIFVVESDHALYTAAETAPESGTFSGFAKLGGYVIGNPAADFQSNGLLDVFVLGSDHAIYVKRQATTPGVGTWNGFEKLGGFFISNPVVTADNFGGFCDASCQVNVFVIGSNHAVNHLAQVGADSDTWAFEGLGGYVIGDPGTGSFFKGSSTGPTPQVFEIFVVGRDQALYYNQNPTFCGEQCR